MRRLASCLLLLAICAGAAPQALAQSLKAGSADEADGASKGGARGRTQGGASVRVAPYLEAGQVISAELSPGDDVVTYSTLAAGVDASIQGRHNQAALSLRYERRFGWGDVRDSDTISGLARASAAVVPRTLTIEAGAMAARNRVEADGGTVTGALDVSDAVTQIYSAYAGPSLNTHVGDAEVQGHYRFGYTKVESPGAVVLAPGAQVADLFDDSTVHSASLNAGTRPGDPLPFGLGAGATYLREDVSNLDQRVEDYAARVDVTLPVSMDLALVGGVGYEDVEVSSRDAVRDINGLAVVGPDGRFVTDKSSPRLVAYEATGFIWDAGVIWRPSRRTALEAHVGRRYDSTTYYGTFAYAPNARTSINISVYDNVSGFGGRINQALAALPTDFEAARNPLSGDISGCVVATKDGGCLNGVLASVRSSVFRSRGVMGSYSVQLGHLQTGVGAGYDQRKFIAPAGTILAASNGVIDENTWVAAWINGRIDERSRFSTNLYANWFHSGAALAGDYSAIGANAAYMRNITDRLTGTAAIGIDGVQRDGLTDAWIASALLGLRYSF